MAVPLRREVWYADLNPTRGQEQSGRRPVLVVSVNTFNRGPTGLAMVLPITGTDWNISLHVPLKPKEAGTTKQSYILCDAVRIVTIERLVRRRGTISPFTMTQVEDRLRILMDL